MDKTKKQGKNTTKAKNNRKIALLIVFAVIVLFMIFRGLMQYPRINERREQLENLRQEKLYEESRADEVDKLKEIVDTDEYTEKIANEKLGLVHDDEKLFIDVSKKDK